ncbi:cupin domain-containing protein [Amycolatopsis sp. NPDC059021]|uniref:cupin domain-containing protein n=1 Tax=Amycolatopsis sp. NPDC059021 TaxID=3346704 RepID=UPI00366AA6ED
MNVVEIADLTDENGKPLPEFEGRAHGSPVSFIMVSTDVDGAGPRLHRHPYTETFLIRSGQALFTVDDRTLIGRGGQIIVVPPDTPHKFAKTGPGRLEMTDIHASDVFITEWLE